MKVCANIVLCVTGSIAAYKSADITSLLSKNDCNVWPVLSKSALNFVTPMTLEVLSRNIVTTSLFDEKPGWQPGHIELADKADLILIAPATAGTLAKLANGMADDAIGAILLATRAKVLVAPAMNGKMWDHPATVNNVATLKDFGWEFIGPDEGMLACGYEGNGKLWPVEKIVERTVEIVKTI